MSLCTKSSNLKWKPARTLKAKLSKHWTINAGCQEGSFSTSDSNNKRKEKKEKKEKTTSMVAQPQVVSVVFVPNIPGSVLQKRLLELEPGLSAISGYRVRYTERSGVTMKQLLHRNNPWAGAPCFRAASFLSSASKSERETAARLWETLSAASRKLLVKGYVTV